MINRHVPDPLAEPAEPASSRPQGSSPGLSAPVPQPAADRTQAAMPEPGVVGRVSALDRLTLQLGVVVAAVIAICSYAVSATSLYALGRQAGYSRWQAIAVPVVADGPAIYGMVRILSRARRGARGAGYGWLLVICGTLASIAGNVAHAQPGLVARGIAAAIPLAVLAMLEALKGDTQEVARLAAQAATRRRPGEGPGRARNHLGPPHRPPTPTAQPDSRSAPDGPRCPPGHDRRTPASATGCRPPMPSRGRTGGPGRPGPWPRPPAVAAAAPPASCNASATRPGSAR